jgi:hypothetical protein
MKAVSIAAACALTLGCNDPVHDQAVDALGPEAPGVSPGPYHRPGQPCAVCHAPQGPANLVFTLAGTVYQHADSAEPLQNAIVRVVDSAGNRAFTGTNCVGNFYFQQSDFDPVFPVWTTVVYQNEIPMSTPIFRNRSCAKCHLGSGDAAHVAQIFAIAPGTDIPLEPCR